MSSSIFSYTSLFFFFFIIPYIQSQPTAPAPTNEASPVNLTAVLETGHQFNTFIRLLNTAQVGFQVSVQLNSSDQGMTVFAPTDNAFNDLKPGTLNSLTHQQQIQLILYHIIPKYYSLNDLLLASNPVRTQATGQGGGVFGLNFTGQGQINQVNVSTGVVETRINNILRQIFHYQFTWWTRYCYRKSYSERRLLPPELRPRMPILHLLMRSTSLSDQE